MFGDCGLRAGADQAILNSYGGVRAAKGECPLQKGDAMIIEYDFAKKARSAEKRAIKPTAANPQSGAKTLGNAHIHLELANARIAKLEAALRNAQAATLARPNESERDQILVDAAEYARLLRCKELVAAALSEG